MIGKVTRSFWECVLVNILSFRLGCRAVDHGAQRLRWPVAIELGLIGFVALLIFSPSGADNPLPLVLAWLLQLPSSLIVMWLRQCTLLWKRDSALRLRRPSVSWIVEAWTRRSSIWNVLMSLGSVTLSRTFKLIGSCLELASLVDPWPKFRARPLVSF